VVNKTTAKLHSVTLLLLLPRPGIRAVANELTDKPNFAFVDFGQNDIGVEGRSGTK
jgi:hypothetical protein